MKTTLRQLLTATLLTTLGTQFATAANVIKLNTTTMVNGTADWSAAPSTTDVGEFNATVSVGNLSAMTLGGPLTLGGLQLDGNLAGPLTLTDANALTLGASGINLLSANQNASLNLNLTLGASQTWSISAGRNLLIGGIISDGTGFGLTKIGNGTLTLTNNNTYIGGTTNNGGTLTLDYSSGAANNIIASSALALGGGTLNTIGAAAGASSQTFTTTAFNPGANTINTGTNGTPVTLALGTRSAVKGATVYIAPTGTNTTINTGGGSFGVFGIANNINTPAGYATFGNSDWATTSLADGTAGTSPYTIIGLSSVSGGYTSVSAGASFQNTPNPGSLNVDLAANVTETANQGGATVRFNTPSANTINENGKWLVVGGFLITTNMGAVNAIITGTASWFADYSTTVQQDGVVWQNNTAAYFNINCPVGNGRDNTGAPFAYIQAGPGTVVMGKVNTYSSQSYLNGGFTVIGANSGLGAIATGAQVNLNGGTVVGTNTFALDNGGLAPRRPFVIGGSGGGLAATAGNAMTVNGVVSSSIAGVGPLTIGIAASVVNGNVQALLPGTGTGTANTTPVIATGTVSLTGANTYSGGTILQSGTLNFITGALGTGGVIFNGGILQWGAATTTDISAQTVTINSGGATIDVNGNTVTFASSIGNGGSGALTVTNSGVSGGLFLNGGASHTGGTTIATGATFGGTGSLAGSVTWNTGAFAKLTPGSAMSVAGVATFNGNTITANATALTGGVYTLLTAASISGTVNSVPGGSGTIASGYNGVVSISGNNLILTVTATGTTATWNNGNGNQNWSDPGNWTPGVPKLPGDSATFGAAGGSAITLNANETVGGINFNNPSSDIISGGNILTLDNLAHVAAVTVSAGTANAINTSVALNDNATVTVASGKSVALGGTISNVSGSKTISINGAGTTVLSAANSYGPAAGSIGTTLGGSGTLRVGNNSALGAGDVSVSDDITLQSGAAALNISNNVAITVTKTATVDSSGNNLALAGVISGNGTLSKVNGGTLVLNGANTYAGGTILNAGIVSVSADGAAAGNAGNLGVVPSVATPNNIILNGGDLLASASLALQANRGIGLGPISGGTPGTGLIDSATGQTNIINGVIASAGNTGSNSLTLNSVVTTPGTVVLAGANTYRGNTTISNGVLQLANAAALQNSPLNYSSGTLSFGTLTAATLGGLNGTKNLSLSNDALAAVTLTLGNNDNSSTYTGVLSGNGGLTKVGTGQFAIGSGATGGASYSGGTVVNNGALRLGGVGSIVSTANFRVGAAAGNSSVTLLDSASVVTTGLLSVSDDLGAGFPAGSTLTVQNNASISASTFSFGGAGSRVPAGTSVIVQDNGALNIAGNFDLNHSIGGTAQNDIVNLNGGVMTAGRFSATQAGGVHQATINFNGGTLRATTNDPASGTFLPAFTGVTVNVTNAASPARIDSAGFNVSIAANLVNTPGNPDAGLVKLGTGTLNLLGANTYNGLTTVSNGTLYVSTALQAVTESFVMNDGKSFGVINNVGSGQSAQVVDLTLGNNNGGATVVFTNVADINTPLLVSSGTLTLNGNSVLRITDSANLTATNEYPLIRYTSVVTNSGSGFSLVLPTGLTATLTNDAAISAFALIVTHIAVIPPTFNSVVVSGNDLVLSASGGTPGAAVNVLTSTNLTVPLASWTTVTSGNFDGSGNFSYTVTGVLSSGLPQQFYVLQVP